MGRHNLPPENYDRKFFNNEHERNETKQKTHNWWKAKFGNRHADKQSPEDPYTREFNGAIRDVKGRLQYVDLHDKVEVPPLRRSSSRALRDEQVFGLPDVQAVDIVRPLSIKRPQSSLERLIEERSSVTPARPATALESHETSSLYSSSHHQAAQSSLDVSASPFAYDMDGNYGNSGLQTSSHFNGREVDSSQYQEDPLISDFNNTRTAPGRVSHIHGRRIEKTIFDEVAENYSYNETRSSSSPIASPVSIAGSTSTIHPIRISCSAQESKEGRVRTDDQSPSMLTISQQLSGVMNDDLTTSSTAGVYRRENRMLEKEIMSQMNSILRNEYEIVQSHLSQYDGEDNSTGFHASESQGNMSIDDPSRRKIIHDSRILTWTTAVSSQDEANYNHNEEPLPAPNNRGTLLSTPDATAAQGDLFFSSASQYGDSPRRAISREVSSRNSGQLEQGDAYSSGFKRLVPLQSNIGRRPSTGFSRYERAQMDANDHSEVSEREFWALRKDLEETRSKAQSFQSILQRTSQRFVNAQIENEELKRQLQDLREHQKLLQDALSSNNSPKNSEPEYPIEVQEAMEENRRLKRQVKNLVMELTTREEEVRVLVETVGQRQIVESRVTDEERVVSSPRRNPPIVKIGARWKWLRKWLIG